MAFHPFVQHELDTKKQRNIIEVTRYPVRSAKRAKEMEQLKKDAEGLLFYSRLPVAMWFKPHDEQLEWLSSHCKGRWHLFNGYNQKGILFEKKEDALLFKLTWETT